MKRVFLIVLDSFGIGEMPDAEYFNDEGSDTLGAVLQSEKLAIPNLERLGLFQIEGVSHGRKETIPVGAYARMTEASNGKDTTTGHWEIAGVISKQAMPVFKKGFPEELICQLSKATGRSILCNKPYSGTKVIEDYGEKHLQTGALIVYTSADSVLQIAAHEDVIPVEKLYEYCEIARQLCVGDFAVGRVIARPFVGKPGAFVRTTRRHDFSLKPPKKTMLDILKETGKDVIAIGKISDIFAGEGITRAKRTSGNTEGIKDTIAFLKEEFCGLCFTNLVDFDMLYGHRNDREGYANALTEFDKGLGIIMQELLEEDLLMITADHGCDPSTPSTDHSREYTPWLIYGKGVKENVNLGTRNTFADIAATILDYFGIPSKEISGSSVKNQILKNKEEER